MKNAHLSEMINGWFVGNFEPCVLKTEAVEVAVKHYVAGAREPLHHHRVATEITLVVSGRIVMAGREWGAGDIIRLDPCEASDFEALTDACTVVVKCPGALNDKYLGAPPAKQALSLWSDEHGGRA